MLSFTYFGLLINRAGLYMLILEIKGSQSFLKSNEHENTKRLVESFFKISEVWLDLCPFTAGKLNMFVICQKLCN